jgi:translocation protein SEC63
MLRDMIQIIICGIVQWCNCFLQLDVKEAPEVPTEHPQWDMLDDEEEVPEGGGSDISEFTTDEDVEDE